MKAKDIIEIMERRYPLSLQESWDKSGLQIGSRNTEVHKIMIALDLDKYTVDQAIKADCDMMITHHPFLLNDITPIDPDTANGYVIKQVLTHNMVVYSSHTPLDFVDMNEWLIHAMDVENVTVSDDKMSRIAKFKEPMSFDNFIEHVKQSYGLEHIRFAGYKDTIQTVAILGGSGASLMEEFFGKVDAFITGDTKYHQAQNAVMHDLVLVDIGHFAEHIMINKLHEYLQQEVDVEIVEANSNDYYTYL